MKANSSSSGIESELEKILRTGKHERWPFASKWNPRSDTSKVAARTNAPPKLEIDRTTGIVTDAAQPEFYFQATECDLMLSLTSYRIVQADGSYRILGVGQISMLYDFFGIIGFPNVRSVQVSVGVYPLSMPRGAREYRSLFGYSPGFESDAFVDGSEEKWYAEAFIEDGILRAAVDAIQRKPPTEIRVSLVLGKGVFRKQARSPHPAPLAPHERYYLCPKLERSASMAYIDVEAAIGDQADLSLIGETVTLKDADEELAFESNQTVAPIIIALDALKRSIDRLSLFLLLVVFVALGVAWLVR